MNLDFVMPWAEVSYAIKFMAIVQVSGITIGSRDLISVKVNLAVLGASETTLHDQKETFTRYP